MRITKELFEELKKQFGKEVRGGHISGERLQTYFNYSDYGNGVDEESFLNPIGIQAETGSFQLSISSDKWLGESYKCLRDHIDLAKEQRYEVLYHKTRVDKPNIGAIVGVALPDLIDPISKIKGVYHMADFERRTPLTVAEAKNPGSTN